MEREETMYYRWFLRNKTLYRFVDFARSDKRNFGEYRTKFPNVWFESSLTLEFVLTMGNSIPEITELEALKILESWK